MTKKSSSKQPKAAKSNASANSQKGNPVENQKSKTSWSDKYSISLDLKCTYTIPQLGIDIQPIDMTLDDADKCYALGCDWIKLK